MQGDKNPSEPDRDIIPADLNEHDIERILDSLPEEQVAVFVSRSISDFPGIISQVTSWQAPLPPAKMLQQYDEISSGFADRIMKSAEREQEHRHSCEKSALGASIQSNQRGQRMGFSIAVIMILMTGALIWAGHTVASTIFGGFTILGLVSLFMTGRMWPFKSKSDENDDDEEPED